MNTPSRLVAAAAALAALPLLVTAAPNILLIYADDIGYGDLGAYGATAIPTPNLDRLALTGLRFTSAYATSATCTPSRYSLLTGEYAFRQANAIILEGNDPLLIDPAKPTLASVLRDAGYDTALVGKWHLGMGTPDAPANWNGLITPGPNEVGFSYSFHMAATGDRVPAVYIENGRVVGLDPSDPITVSYTGPIDDSPSGLTHPHLLKTQADEQHAKTIVDGTSRIGYMTGGHAARWTDEQLPDEFLNRAVAYLEQPREKPFFLFYATHENHVPRIPHPRFRGSSGLGVRGDAVVQFDWGVGVLIETLRAQGKLENTLIIVSSDNGPVLYDGYYDGAMELNGDHRPAGPHRGGKYSAYEGGTRMPFLVSWPGTVRPGLTDALFSQVDLVRSLATIAGATVAPGGAPDSLDHSAALLGRDLIGRDHVVQQGVQMVALRQGPWKYFPPGHITNRMGPDVFQRDPVPASGALFYLPEDPEERRNLATRYPAVAREMAARLREIRRGSPESDSASDPLGGAVQR